MHLGSAQKMENGLVNIINMSTINLCLCLIHDFAKNKNNFTTITITGNQPQCKPITCGQPPEVLNARFYLTNGTSTAWQSLARYSCKPGFKMVYQDSKY